MLQVMRMFNNIFQNYVCLLKTSIQKRKADYLFVWHHSYYFTKLCLPIRVIYEFSSCNMLFPLASLLRLCLDLNYTTYVLQQLYSEYIYTRLDRMGEQETRGNVENSHSSLRVDERKQLVQCRRNAIGSGVLFGGLAWLASKFLIKNTALGKTFIGRHPIILYSVAIGTAFYQGVAVTAKSCFRGLANLEDSKFGEIGRRALQMAEDRKNLSKGDFLQKYPREVQKALFSIASPETTPPDHHTSISDATETEKQDMFCPTKGPELPHKPKSFQELQNQNRSVPETSPYHIRDHRPRYNLPKDTTKQIDTTNLPPGPEGKLKAKRNKYGDVVHEE